MLTALLLAALAARAGLALRRARRVAGRRAELRRRHLRLARPAVILALIGFVGGPLSMAWLRDRPPFETAHAVAGSLAAACFLAAGWLGHRLEHGQGSRDLHATLGVAALLAGAVAAVMGFVLLP